MKPAYVLAFVILALSMGVTLYSFSGSVAHHVNIGQAISRAGEMVQVPGKILKDTVTYDPVRGQLRFDIVDMADPSKRMTILYNQAKPENFDSATSVEAIGQYRDGVFHAHKLLVKCPSKYNDQPAKK
jgi:cytochrome c-type biogenesis protein CcmE